MSRFVCAECGNDLAAPVAECPACSQKYNETKTNPDGIRSHRTAKRRRLGLIAVIVLVIATVARVLVKFLPAIKGYLHLK
jgi:predicted ATP-dependent serine protease